MYGNILCRNKDFTINKNIIVKQPTVSEILDFGEEKYWNIVNTLCVCPADVKHILFDKYGLNFDETDDFSTFIKFIKSISTEEASILFKEFDVDSLELGFNTEIGEEVLYAPSKSNFIFDRAIYQIMVDFIREMHNFIRNDEKAGNEHTRKFLIDLSRDDAAAANKKPFESVLIPMGMFLCNTNECKYNYEEVWDLPLYVFMSSYKIIIKNKYVDNKLKAFYTNVYNSAEALKSVQREYKNLNYTGEPK